MASPDSTTDRFASLAIEIRALFLGYLPYDSFLVMIHTSKALRAACGPDACQGQICRALLARNVDENILPIAIALFHAENTNWEIDSRASYADKVVEFCDEHLKGHRAVVAHIETDQLKMTIRILKFNQVAQDIAQLLAIHVGKGIPRARRPNEWLRLVKCVYIYELARVILGQNVPVFNYSRVLGIVPSTARRSFWRCFAPWEVAGLESLEECLVIQIVDKANRPDIDENPGWSLEKIHSALKGKMLPIQPFEIQFLRFFSVIEWEHSFIWDQVLDVAQQYQGDQHIGPRDLYVWSRLIGHLRQNSPLQEMKRGWEDVFRSEPLDGFNSPLAMRRYCFQDRHTLEGSYPYPTMQEMVKELLARICPDGTTDPAFQMLLGGPSN
ncbi:hypothetical protein F5Y06DRAFT_299598 [Hypoxylon sp. FL0890]|nr:hypothetical protein F5Y06DRAFT_299598 [Hypoxylon sp. FL0890]